jgi:hypothetical protein
MGLLEAFPLLLIPVLIYNLAVLLSSAPPPGSAAPTMIAAIAAVAIDLPMLSGTRLSLSWGDLLLVLALVCLMLEVIKATRTTSLAIFNHMLSMGVFVLCLIEFLLLKSFSTATFFLLTVIVLLDAMAGMAVSIVAARRDFDVGSSTGAG